MRILLACLCLLGIARAETYQDPKAAAFYAAHPDFFRFATPADLPKDLVWRDGTEQAEFADPRAVRGGVLRQFIMGTPPTLRRVGPNANNGFRGELYDNNDFGLLAGHPDTDEVIPTLSSPTASRSRSTTFSTPSTSTVRRGPRPTGMPTTTRGNGAASPDTTTIPWR